MKIDEPKQFWKNSCFSVIFDPSDPYENYPDKKRFDCSLKPACQCMNCKNNNRACKDCLSDKKAFKKSWKIAKILNDILPLTFFVKSFFHQIILTGFWICLWWLRQLPFLSKKLRSIFIYALSWSMFHWFLNKHCRK